MAGTDNTFAYKMIIFAMAIIFFMGSLVTIYVNTNDDNPVVNELVDGYNDLTGTIPTKEAVWALTGIYTPYAGQEAYGYTDDGWLYGSRIVNYKPSQYQGGGSAYEVTRGDDDLYRYAADTNDGHKAGDLYTAVCMDEMQKSSIFFTSNNKVDGDKWFYYDYTGYRYSFQPVKDYNGRDTAGNTVPIVATTTSLSLIWYDYYNSSGISGQLIISGSDSGVAYLTADQILRAFDSVTNTSKFLMNFNGIDMNIYIRLNPYYLSGGDYGTPLSVEECYKLGYWDLMVTSLSTDSDAYTGTDYAFNVADLFDTIVKLFTFNAEELGLSGWSADLASIVISMPLYAGLLSIAMTYNKVLILAGILAALQALSIV